MCSPSPSAPQEALLAGYCSQSPSPSLQFGVCGWKSVWLSDFQPLKLPRKTLKAALWSLLCRCCFFPGLSAGWGPWARLWAGRVPPWASFQGRMTHFWSPTLPPGGASPKASWMAVQECDRTPGSPCRPEHNCAPDRGRLVGSSPTRTPARALAGAGWSRPLCLQGGRRTVPPADSCPRPTILGDPGHKHWRVNCSS